MRIQISLTVEEAKRIIAQGIATLPEVRRARTSGKILLKGGTTVSAVSEALCGKPLSILGRISPRGARTAAAHSGAFHCALLCGGELRDADARLEKTALELQKDDIILIGANAIDAFGHAAMMYGVALGGPPGHIISGLMAEHDNLIVAAGTEKLVPGNLTDIIRRSHRLGVDKAMGMAVGLTPVVGRIFTEIEAICTLGKVDCWVIGKGGIQGAEGATTLLVEGSKQETTKILKAVGSVRGSTVSGIPETLADCVPPHASCNRHHGCIFKKVRHGDGGAST